MKPVHLRYVLFGMGLGFALSRIGYTDYDEVHRMFLFADMRLFYTFLIGAAVTGIGFLLVARGTQLTEKRIHPGVFAGSVAFGIGWALTGACPGVAFAQVGEGKLAALATVAGIFLGNWLYSHVHRRFFRWDPGSCG